MTEIKNSFFVSPTDTITVKMSEHLKGSKDTVVMRKLNIGDREKLSDAASEHEIERPEHLEGNRAQRRAASKVNDAPPASIKAKMKSIQVMYLTMAIVSWTFKYSSANSASLIPISEETIAQLDPHVADFLEIKAAEINPA